MVKHQRKAVVLKTTSNINRLFFKVWCCATLPLFSDFTEEDV